MQINLNQITFCFVALCCCIFQTYAFRSDYSYVESTGSYYKFHRKGAKWHDAISRCQSEGAIMFHPESKYELVQALRAANFERDKGLKIRLGFSDLQRNGFYATVDGRPVSQIYNNWTKGQPRKDARTGYHCGGLNGKDLTIFVGDCNAVADFMCKYKPISVIGTTETKKVNTVLDSASSTLVETLKQNTETMQRQVGIQTIVLKQILVAMQQLAGNETIALNRIAKAMQKQAANQTAASNQIAEVIQQVAIQTTAMQQIPVAMQQKAANETAALEQIVRAMQEQAANQTAASEQIAEVIQQQVAIQTTAMQQIPVAMQQHAANETAALERIAEVMQQQAEILTSKLLKQQSEAIEKQAAVQTAILQQMVEAMQRQALALEKLFGDNDKLPLRSEQ